ncbi:Protein of unknown function (DUF2892) [Lutibacter oceani]|uniref:Inner membrane protein YgaP-like transmembrane domain-containing protein n=1 Tax=Lutibacter oceani TaxID=1853311 RepID=A0A3D9RMB4_9FLAO|nr:DUF2892 domain-containing protein [Lutibacter oceani]REE80708.1 Protein of unknown function (DUF2892) [Lutibacter oceani]
MNKNIGSTDKIIRVVLGIAISYFAYSASIDQNWIRTVLFIISAILFITTAFSICPLYKLFGINTCEIKK